jgi:hypothetical protein
VPRHLWHFEAAHVPRLGADAGLKPAGVRHFSLEYGPYGWFQSAASALGLGNGLFTHVLRARRLPSAVTLGRALFRGDASQSMRAAATHLALFGALLAVGTASVPLEVLASVGRAGGAVVVTLRA